VCLECERSMMIEKPASQVEIFLALVKPEGIFRQYNAIFKFESTLGALRCESRCTDAWYCIKYTPDFSIPSQTSALFGVSNRLTMEDKTM
jgi:hypothetical protein